MKVGWTLAMLATLLAGCAGGGGTVPTTGGHGVSAPVDDGERYALSSDAYPQQPPDVSEVPDAVPRVEAPSRAGNRPTYEVWGETYHVLPDARGYARQGTASWYGKKFHGYATSNGEIYDMYRMSAAHRSLPLPTYARVTSLDNGRSVIVRVNDRGPFHSDREIDLSYAAAARLDILDEGTGRVRVEAIDPRAWLAEHGRQDPGESAAGQASTEAADGPVSRAVAESRPEDGPLYLQVAALGSAENARRLRSRLQDTLARPVRVNTERGLHRVQVGPLDHAGQADPLQAELRRAGYEQAFIVDDAD
ncbi:septal ring lytic transglycosylase RlpA family protein [Halomonas cerina]|uniref:Endolytic peptidoglycan transglycosylase RlpA n=1 Tax=Halomonas cerina TaxID=447424 RepID=A0A839V6E0_9GAMM|nr:septal ring lytic transglycosylase RlpA family protein [Halomonas cerina]MBB3189365.1 rare lipoprotein A [Halomonas cerina]